MKYNYCAVVVVYNKNVNDSLTIQELRRIKNHSIDIIIVDNSTKDYDNEISCVKNNWKYISMHGNSGLSKAYNSALDYIGNKKCIIIWLDDDTMITQEYFDVLSFETISNPQIDIFAPIIKGQDGKFWSPNEYYYLKNKQLRSEDGHISEKRFNAINSCTAVRSEVYTNYRYTENLFLDQVDHQFFEDQRELGRKFKKMDIVINHNFSTKNKMDSIESVKNRYSIMIPDFLTFCNKSTIRYTIGWFKVLGWGIRESLRYKKPGFLIWVIETATKYHNDKKGS